MITIEKVYNFSFKFESKKITMKINNGFSSSFCIDEYIYDFIENIIECTVSWNYPLREVNFLLEKDKITCTYTNCKFVFENNNIVRNEFRRFLEELNNVKKRIYKFLENNIDFKVFDIKEDLENTNIIKLLKSDHNMIYGESLLDIIVFKLNHKKKYGNFDYEDILNFLETNRQVTILPDLNIKNIYIILNILSGKRNNCNEDSIKRILNIQNQIKYFVKDYELESKISISDIFFLKKVLKEIIKSVDEDFMHIDINSCLKFVDNLVKKLDLPVLKR